MKSSFDPPLILAASIIVSFGILIHYSISPDTLNLHITFLAAGTIIAIASAYLDAKTFPHLAWHLYILALLLLTTTLIFGVQTRGSTRWIDLGPFSFQPSEFAKPLIILAFAQFLSQSQLHYFSHLLKLIPLVLIPTILVYLQPDLGSAFIFVIVLASMFFAAGLRFRHQLLFLLTGLLASPAFWFLLKDYQKSRLLTFLNPELDPLGKGYNTIQSLIAVGSGQFFGRGLGHGTQSKLRFLPEYQTDFVFASLAEELGFLGSAFLLLTFIFLVTRIFSLASHSTTSFSYLSILGLGIMFASQLFINVGMNLGILPITGITLPLVSSGGSSLLTSLISLGLIISLNQPSPHTQTIEIT